MGKDEQRRNARTPLRADVTLWHPQLGELRLQTRDISDGGAYCASGSIDGLAVGDSVEVQVQGLPGGSAPVVAMRVVRVDAEGVALAFIDPPEAERAAD